MATTTISPKFRDCDPQGRAREASPESSAAFAGCRKGWVDYPGTGSVD